MDRLYKAISDPTRREIVRLLRKHGELNLSEVAEHFELTKPTLSNHLKVLTDTGLLIRDKRGREVFFTINTSVAEDLLTELAGVFFGEEGEQISQEFGYE